MKKYCVADYVGKRFGMVVVVGKDNAQSHFNSNSWIFQCDCGKVFSNIPSRIINGYKKSCGCHKGKGNLKHGLSGDPFFGTWEGMMGRCYNSSADSFKNYGGRGIQVCEDWHNVESFINWAHETCACKKGLSLDRIDNNGNYSPENCRWVPLKKQNHNKRNTRFETINGETRPFVEWCELYGMDKNVVRLRTDSLGWDIERALTQKYNESKCGHHGGHFVRIGERTENVSTWCKELGLSRSTYRRRIKAGWDDVSALIIPTNRKKTSSKP